MKDVNLQIQKLPETPSNCWSEWWKSCGETYTQTHLWNRQGLCFVSWWSQSSSKGKSEYYNLNFMVQVRIHKTKLSLSQNACSWKGNQKNLRHPDKLKSKHLLVSSIPAHKTKINPNICDICVQIRVSTLRQDKKKDKIHSLCQRIKTFIWRQYETSVSKLVTLSGNLPELQMF